ncbi:hypothetical protein ACEWY4_025357 [Coilia grayii]|uniref:ZP domain-containing protein n=1 Tax=Coilia grayii TaxID=363190 RepID=A0ABD1IXD9_9TELE
MEVSVKPQIPAPHNYSRKWIDAPPMSSEEKKRLKQEGWVIFYRPGDVQQQRWTVREVLSLGYVIGITDLHVLLRCPYFSPQSHRFMDKEVLVEAVSAVFLLQRQELPTVVDVSVACTINDALVDGEHLVWSSPLVLHPLVHGVFQHSSVRLGVGSEALSGCLVRDRGYQVTANNGVLQARIPFGADGTLARAVEVDGRLFKVISLDLFLMREWQDDLWPLTQQRTFRLLHSPYLPHTPEVINDTVCSENIFSITVGVFPWEMSFKTLYIGGEPVSWPEAKNQALHISQIHYKNGSYSYQLRVPFSYSSISQKRIRGGYRRLSLAFILTLSLTPNAKELNYSATVVCDVKEAADSAPWLEGRCRESGVQVLLHYGSRERPWELYVGGRRLDWELVELGGFELELEEDYLSVELPLFAPGMTYENITLQSLVAKVEVSVVELDTVQVQHSLTQRCSFPVRDLLVCLPEGRMVVVVDTSRTLPPTTPNSTTLMDPSCGPSQTDSTRALFNFSLNSCGTTQAMEGDYLVYENQVVYTPDLQPTKEPIIHRHSPYRLTIQCRFPANHTDLASFWSPVNSWVLFSPPPSAVCDPKGVVSVVASTTMVSPRMNPNKTSLLDSRCRPMETDNSRVLFIFTVDTCGTKSRIGANYVTYENEIVLLQDILSARQAFITRDSDFRLTIRCNYRATAISTLSVDSVPRGSILTPGRGSVVEKRQDKTRKRKLWYDRLKGNKFCWHTFFIAQNTGCHCNHADVLFFILVPFSIECQGHHLAIFMLLSGDSQPSFKALGMSYATGEFPITEDNGAQCGYTYRVYPMMAVAILRASYFSCYTENKDDMTFTFNFHLTTVVNDEEVAYNITKMCSPSHPWADQEVTCEENYMEVSVQADLSCLNTQSVKDVPMVSALPQAQEAVTSFWQMMFLKQGEDLVVLSVDKAKDLGYFFDVTPGRMVFRAPYRQPHSEVGTVSGLTVEMIRPAVFLQQRLTTMMVDLVAACTQIDEVYENGTLVWRTPTVMVPLVFAHSEFRSEHVDIGVMGKSLDHDTAAERGYTVDVGPEIIEISIPSNAEGGIRTSFVMNNTYHESYFVDLYYEHTFTMDDGALEGRLRQFKPMTTPIMFHVPFMVNLTVLEDRVFTVYVGSFPYDVDLVSVNLNGEYLTVEDAIQKGYEISKVPHDNVTHAYTICVPFEDPLVSKLYYVEGIQQYSLSINYTLHIMPQRDEYFYFTTVVAQILDVYPPSFNGLCMENGIKFRLDHQEFDRLWVASIGLFPLTQELADTRGYIMTNSSQNLTLDVPLFAPGYIYENISLEHISATFEILIRNAESLEVVESSAKTCQFTTPELLLCAPNGIMTVVSDLSQAKPDALPSKTTLLDKTCTPKEVDETRVLFEFALNSCGTRVEVTNDTVIYENEVQFEPSLTPEKNPIIMRDSAYR